MLLIDLASSKLRFVIVRTMLTATFTAITSLQVILLGEHKKSLIGHVKILWI